MFYISMMIPITLEIKGVVLIPLEIKPVSCFLDAQILSDASQPCMAICFSLLLEIKIAKVYWSSLLARYKTAFYAIRLLLPFEMGPASG